MPLHPTLADIGLRIGLAFLAGLIIGFNRGERNEAAGLRTTLLVCLAAALAGVLANLLLATTGKNIHDFAQIDVLRLPLGILSGIGFIGAGAIIKKDDIALGVTTAATMWFISVIGLCFGTGFVMLGVAGTLLGLLVLWALKHLDKRMPRALRSTLTVEADGGLMPEAALRDDLARRYRIISWSSEHRSDGWYRATAVLQWTAHEKTAGDIPPLISELSGRKGLLALKWHPASTGD